MDQQRGNLAQAISKWEEARSIIPENAYTKEEADIAEALYQGYKAQNRSTKALFHLERFKLLQDSLYGEENTKALARLELQKEFEQEKKDLAYLQEKVLLEKDAELNRQRNLQWASAIALLLAGIFITIILRYYRMRRLANEKLQKLNQEIRQQKEELEELSQVKSRFFTNISHELRTPLTIIGGMVKQIRKQPRQWLDKGLTMIERNNGNLLRLVNQILDLRKLESGNLALELTHGDIISYLRFIVESFQSFAESKHIRLHFLDYSKQVEMDYDPEKILQVMSNLLSNAIKFTPEEGEVYLSVNVEKDVLNNEVNRLLVMLKDTGVGIPKNQQAHIFDRFYQVDDSATREGEGTGIGLALTKELVHLMKGKIEVQSEEGRGSTFLLKLPIESTVTPTIPAVVPPFSTVNVGFPFVSAIQATEQEEDVSIKTANGTDQDHLLIIEDNPDVVDYLTAIIGNSYLISVAKNGEEGIQKAVNEIPDIIISDVMMPIKDGFEVCATLKEDERTSHIPIVLLTAKVDQDSKMQGLRRGADDYLAKPFNEKELGLRLQNLLSIRQTLKQRYQNLNFTPASKEEHALQLEDSFISKLKTVIEDRLEDPEMSMPEICKEMGMSRSQLYKKVKALTNSTTTQIIRSIRLNRAKELLQDSERSIYEVAYDVGFKDPAYFSRTFSEEYGMSPREFRKEQV